MDRYERFVLRRYVANILTAAPRKGKARPPATVLSWLADNRRLLGIRSLPEGLVSEWADDDARSIEPELTQQLVPIANRLRRGAAEPDPSALEKRLRWLSAALRLQDHDAEILGALVRCFAIPEHRRLVQSCGNWSWDDREVDKDHIAWTLGIPIAALKSRLSRNSSLMQLGLVETTPGDECLTLAKTVSRIAHLKSNDPKRLQSLLLGARQKTELVWTDFDHLGEGRDLAEKLIGAALDGPARGIWVNGIQGGCSNCSPPNSMRSRWTAARHRVQDSVRHDSFGAHAVP